MNDLSDSKTDQIWGIRQLTCSDHSLKTKFLSKKDFQWDTHGDWTIITKFWTTHELLVLSMNGSEYGLYR